MSTSLTRTRLGAVALVVAGVLFILYPAVRPWKDESTLDGATNPVSITTFSVGLLMLGVGAVLAAVAVWRSGALPRYSGIVFALGFALFIPQFYTPPAVRIAHGLLVAAGLAWLAQAMWTARTAEAQ